MSLKSSLKLGFAIIIFLNHCKNDSKPGTSKSDKQSKKAKNNKDPGNIVLNLMKTYLCGKCEAELLEDPAGDDEASISCNTCRLWFHYKWTNLIIQDFRYLSKANAAIEKEGTEVKKLQFLEDKILELYS